MDDNEKVRQELSSAITSAPRRGDFLTRATGITQQTSSPFPGAASPVRMLMVLTSTVFLVELSIMVAFSLLLPIPEWVENLLDAFILAALLFPALYY